MAVLPFGSAPSPFKRSTSAIIVPALSSYNEIRGNAGGLTITGGTGSGDDLDLKSTSHATKGVISTEFNSTLKLFGQDTTFTAAANHFLEASHTYTVDYASSTLPSMIRASFTGSFNQSGSPFGIGALFQAVPTLKNVSGVTANLGPFYVLASQPTVQADGANISQSLQHGIYDTVNWTTANSGTLAVGTHYSMLTGGAVGSGVTINNRIPIILAGNSGSGIIRNLYGLYVQSTTLGTDKNHPIYTESGTVRFGDDQLTDDSTKGIVSRDSLNNRWRRTVDTLGVPSTAQVTFSPFTDMSFYSMFIADSIAQSNGTSVATWRDQSGNFRDLAQTNGSIQPTYKTSDANLNSQPSVGFASASSQTIFNSIGMSSGTPFTIICVMTFATLAATQRVIGTNSGANNRGFGASATPNWTVQLSSTATSSGTPATATKYFVRIYGAASTQAMYINEVAGPSNTSTPAGFNRLYLGSGLGTANYFDGTIAWVGVYSGDITTHNQWANLKSYFNTKYGFSL